MRTAARLVALSMVTLGVWYWVWVPYRSNLTTRRVRAQTESALSADPTRAVLQARLNLERLTAACGRFPCNQVEVLMLRAVNERLLGRNEAAEQLYLRALRRDRRPELYLNLGSVQLEMGKQQEAIDNLSRAARFDRSLMYDGSIPAGALVEVQRRSVAEERRINESARGR